jgi:hypothetical protein
VVECWRNTNPESQIDVDDHYQKVTLLCVDFPSDYHKEVHKYLREASALSIGNPVKPSELSEPQCLVVTCRCSTLTAKHA